MEKDLTLKEQKIANEGKKFIAKVYGWMAIALLISSLFAVIGYFGIVAVVYSTSEEQAISIINVVLWALIIGELILVIFLSSKIQTMSLKAATTGFIFYSIIDGLTLSVIFLQYSPFVIAKAFLITAGMFGGMTLYGRKTKQDLRSAGRYLFMALIGLIIASVINILFKSSFLDWLISIITIVVFVGLTAYDTQKIYKASEIAANNDTFKKAAIIGALELYLDFINIFLSILKLFGRKK